MDKHARALAAYSAAITHAPDATSQALYHRNRVGVQIELGQLEAAGDDCERALALDPHNPYTHERFGDLYIALKAYEDATDNYRRAIEGEPSAPRHFGLGLGLLTLDRLAEARTAYRAGQEIASRAEIKQALEDLQDVDHAPLIRALLTTPAARDDG